MHYLIQEDLFSERNYYTIVNQIEKMGFTFEIISILPFTTDIKKRINGELVDFTLENKNVFCFGSVKFAHIAKKYNWSPGSMFNDNHDFEVYSKFYKENLLNYPYTVQNLSHKLPENIPTLFFARPCKDTKLFTGGVFMKGSWNDMVKKMNDNDYHSSKNISEEKVMFSPLKEIAYETRCWVVDGKVISMSEYRRGRYTIYKNVDDNLLLKDQVQKLVDIYQPADAFVIDVCETINNPGELKIVEINCINCSGFYLGDMQKVIIALEEKFNED